jgi:hypothetical protein
MSFSPATARVQLLFPETLETSAGDALVQHRVEQLFCCRLENGDAYSARGGPATPVLHFVCMPETYCDECVALISAGDANALEIRFTNQRRSFHLFGACSSGVIGLLKQMRLIKDEPVIH